MFAVRPLATALCWFLLFILQSNTLVSSRYDPVRVRGWVDGWHFRSKALACGAPGGGAKVAGWLVD